MRQRLKPESRGTWGLCFGNAMYLQSIESLPGYMYDISTLALQAAYDIESQAQRQLNISQHIRCIDMTRVSQTPLPSRKELERLLALGVINEGNLRFARSWWSCALLETTGSLAYIAGAGLMACDKIINRPWNRNESRTELLRYSGRGVGDIYLLKDAPSDSLLEGACWLILVDVQDNSVVVWPEECFYNLRNVYRMSDNRMYPSYSHESLWHERSASPDSILQFTQNESSA